MATMLASFSVQRQLAGSGAEHLDLGMTVALQALHQHELGGANAGEQALLQKLR
jgi:hypothetical protein